MLNEDFDVGESLINMSGYYRHKIGTVNDLLPGIDEEKAGLIKTCKYEVFGSIEKFKDKF